MSRPFAQMIDEIDPITPTTARNLKAVNRDLSTMSTVAKHLALTSWKPRIHNTLIMDFAGATVAIQEEKNTELRPPGKKEELECLFRSPLYQGGGAGKNRLKAGSVTPQVWHDAAYWAPLIWYYTHACGEEICGLEVADVFADHPVPHIFIRENFTRGRDGEKAGENGSRVGASYLFTARSFGSVSLNTWPQSKLKATSRSSRNSTCSRANGAALNSMIALGGIWFSGLLTGWTSR